jgi:hypothetical protein
VVVAVDGLPDLPVPERDREHMAGNHVIVSCDLSARPAGEGAPEVWVVLGHLRQGSVRVSPGDVVAVGDPLGRVGNSGNTDEPHLHIHAQTPGTTAAPLSGEPLPMLIDGAWLARNQRITRSVDSTPVSMPSPTPWAEELRRVSSDTRRFP